MSFYTFDIDTTFLSGINQPQLASEFNNAFGETPNMGSKNFQLSIAFANIRDFSVVKTIITNHIPQPFSSNYNVFPRSYVGKYDVNALKTALGANAIYEDIQLVCYFNVPQDQTTVANAISSFVNPELPREAAFVINPSENFVREVSSNIVMRSQSATEIVVAPAGEHAQYNTIGAAVANIGTAKVIKIYPGYYFEANPINLPAGVTISSQGNAASVILIATNPNATMFNVGPNCYITGITISGSALAYSYDGSVNLAAYVIIKDCVVVGAARAVRCFGGLSSVVLQNFSMFNSGGVLADVSSSIVILDSIIENTMEIPDYGLKICDGAVVTITAYSVYSAQDGLIMIGNSKLRAVLLNCNGCTNAVNFPSAPGRPNFLVATYNADNCISDLRVNNSADIQILTAKCDDNKFINNSSSTINAQITNTIDGTNYCLLSGKLRFGCETVPTSIMMGEGKAYPLKTRAFVCLSGTYTDVSGFAQNESESFNLPYLPGDYLYISRDREFYGMYLEIIDPNNNTSKDAVKLEYYNGTSWTPIPFMIVNSTPARVSNANIFGGSFHINFDQTIVQSNVVVNGMTAKWIRLSPQVILSPSSCKIVKIHNANLSYGGSGERRFDSRARPIRSFTPAFSSTAVNVIYPPNIDVSTPVTINLLFSASTTGSLAGSSFSGQMVSLSIYLPDTNWTTLPLITTGTLLSVTIDYIAFR